MAVVRHRLMKWTGGSSAAGKTRQLVFAIDCSAPNDGPDVVEAYLLSELGIAVGAAYDYEAQFQANNATQVAASESDSSLAVTGISIDNAEASRLAWVATVDYGRGDAGGGNPLLKPAVFSRSSQNREEAFDRDVHGRSVRNSAEDRFDDVLTREVSRTVLRVQKNFASWPQSNYRLVNTVNRTPYRVGDVLYRPRQMRLINMNDDEEFSDVLKSVDNPTGVYVSATLEFCFAEDDWDLDILDQGVRQSFRRFEVTYVDPAGREVLIGGSIVRVSTAIVRANTREEAQMKFLAGRPGSVIPIPARRIANGYEACKERPATDSSASGAGRDSQLPMALDGSGRQLVDGDPVWLQYQGYFEYEFDRFGLV